MTAAAKRAGSAAPRDMGVRSPAAPDSSASIVLLFFAAARVAAGTGREDVRGATVRDVLSAARARHGGAFAAVLDGARVWVNGEPATPAQPLRDGDEVAILPPVSGGALAPAKAPARQAAKAPAPAKRSRTPAKAPAKPRPRPPAGRPRKRSVPAARSRRGRTEVDTDFRPARSVALGLVWALVLLGAAEGGRAVVALVVVPVAVVAAASGVRAAGSRPRSAATVAVVISVVVPVAALGGAVVALVIGSLVVVAGIGLLIASTSKPIPPLVLVTALAPAVAAASVVLASGQGQSEVLTLLAAVCLFDMASFVTGRGPTGGPVGVIAGCLSVAVLAMFVAAVVVPPFSGRAPWVLLGLVAVLAPAGVIVANRIMPGRSLPALRRLDSLVLSGPAWVIGVAVVLHR